MPRFIYIATACVIAAVLGYALGFPMGRDAIQEKYDKDTGELSLELDNIRKALAEKETEANNHKFERDKYKEQAKSGEGVVEFAELVWEEFLAVAIEKAEEEKRWLGVFVASPG